MFVLSLVALLATPGAVADTAPLQRSDIAAKPARPNPAATRTVNLPTMRLEAQFRGPQQDTVVQRWRDPSTNAICYIYLPVVVQHSAPTPTGFVQYGANSIGTISCVSGR